MGRRPHGKANNLASIAAIAAAQLLAAPVYAQEADSVALHAKPRAVGANEEFAPEDIIVHARRRGEVSTTVPLAISVVGAAQLKDQSIVRPQDLGRIAPNLEVHTASDGGGTIQTIMRGQTPGFSGVPYTDQAVGFYFDDVYVALARGLAATLYDLEAVEVSRGVQGTLKGRNNTGGSISFYTRKPVIGDASGEVTGRLGERGLYGGNLALNIPLGQTFALRVAGGSEHRNAFARSVTDGRKYGGVGMDSVRVSALWKPSSRFSSLFTYEWARIDQSAIARRVMLGTRAVTDQLGGVRGANNPSGTRYTLEQIRPLKFYSVAQNNTQNDEVDWDFFRNTTTFEASDTLTFKLLAGYRTMKSLGGTDNDGSPELISQNSNFASNSKQLTIEPQVLFASPNDKFDLVAGYFYFKDKVTYDANPAPTVIRTHGSNESSAVYGHAKLRITDAWDVAGGIRYSEDTRRAVQSQFSAGANNLGTYDLTKKFNYISYEFSSHLEITDQLHGYVRTGLGQRSGGFGLPFATPLAAVSFNPEKLRDYEIGLKGDRLGGIFSFSLAYFYGKPKDIQRTTTQLQTVNGTLVQVARTVNAAAGKVQGVESSFDMKAGPNLSFSGFLSYTDAHYTSFPYDTLAGSVSLADQPYFQTPKWMSRLSAVYTAEVASGELRVAGGWNWQSRRSLALISDPGAMQDAYSLFDARIAWTNRQDTMEFAVFGTNLSNTHYLTASTLAGKTPGGQATYGSLVIGDPRIIGVSATFRF